ncbi:hypothetical protein [Paraliomyxa miuraensis]|uniref:hypothetical protein n=1 Tax=Paraliomyxa miuraensis TaxID=376150 RepID=UPI00224DB699|nr:hypothetical protein [Paraliomyxa miuraensis]MCX4240077.1 hypothetical protein [Paraliomyxa miuraensis]
MSRWAGVAVCCGMACAPPQDESPPIVWSGEHLDFAPQDAAAEVCAGTLPYMDRYMGLAGAALDVEVPRTLYVLGSEEEPNPCNAIACQLGDTIYTSQAPHEHELIHAARQSDPSAYRFFEEGEAVAFGGDAKRAFNDPTTWGSIRDGLESCAGGVPLADRWYPRAGHLYAYLRRRHGAHATDELMRTVPRNATQDEAIAALEESTGLAFDDMIADLEAFDPFCEQPLWFRYPLHPCDAPEALRPRCDGDIAIPVGISLGCESTTALGPRDDEVFGYVAIDIPTDGDYRIQAAPTGDAHGMIEIKECALGCSSRFVALPYRELDFEVWLPAGRYSLRFSRDADGADPSPMAVTIAGDCP